MKILELKFKENEPVVISIEMTVEQAAYLTKITGKTSPASADPPSSYNAQSEFYEVMVDRLFNRYWDDGVDDYFRER